MKYTVIKTFRDRNTKKLYEKGATYVCSAERFKEIQGKGNFLLEDKIFPKTKK